MGIKSLIEGEKKKEKTLKFGLEDKVKESIHKGSTEGERIQNKRKKIIELWKQKKYNKENHQNYSRKIVRM